MARYTDLMTLDELRRRIPQIGITGWFNEDDGIAFYNYLTSTQVPGSYVEIGSWMGLSTSYIALAAKHYSRTMVAIDHFVGSEEHGNLLPALHGTTWPQYKRNMDALGLFDYIRTLRMTTQEALPMVRDTFAPISFLFLDGAHDEVSVTHQINDYGPLVSPGGAILFHDHGCEGVIAALTKSDYLKQHFTTTSLNGMRMEIRKAG